MRYYQDITLLPCAEIPLHFLWSKIFTQLHLAMAEEKRRGGGVAAAFPCYGEAGLGNELRLLSEDKETLERLDAPGALSRMADYVHITGIRPIRPARIKGYARYSRWQPDAALPRKARRYVKRHEGATYEDALALLAQKQEKEKPPYLRLKSLSTGEGFSLFIKKTEEKEEIAGSFSAYGLSADAAVPEF